MRDRIYSWLEKEGYPLEMRTAAAFRSVGFTVRQSQHYVDSESGKSRENDAVCSIEDDLGLASLQIVVECKASNKPWVVFSSEYTVHGYNRLFAIGILSEPARDALVDCVEQAASSLMWFKKSGRVGYNVVQAFAGNHDVPFAAAMSAVKGAIAPHGTSKFYRPPLLATFPVVVIDAPLFECYLDDQGELQLTEIDQSEVLFGVHLNHFSGTCVRIVTLPALTQFVLSAKEELTEFLHLLEPRIKREWETLKKRTTATNDGT